MIPYVYFPYSNATMMGLIRQDLTNKRSYCATYVH